MGSAMRVRVPYVLFETKTGSYGVDAYFSLRVSKVERRAVLIKREDSLTPASKKPENALITTSNVEEYLKELFTTIHHLSHARFRKRGDHMRRWNIWRLIGIPTGHKRHVDEDERLSEESREALLALSILQRVLGVKNPSELEKSRIVPKGYAFLELRIEGGHVSDPVYEELLRIDPGVGMTLGWLK